jgi:anti-anti-sigma factor
MKIIKEGKSMTFLPEGEVKLINQGMLKNEIVDNISLDFDDFIIDMSEVTFIDSSGIGMLLYIYTFLKGKDKNLMLKSVPAETLRILKLAVIDKIMTIL